MKKKPFKRGLSATLAAILATSGFVVTSISTSALDQKYGVMDITIKDVNKRYTDAADLFNKINETRTAAGLSPLVLDEKLTEEAMTRAAELSIKAEDVDLLPSDLTTDAEVKKNGYLYGYYENRGTNNSFAGTKYNELVLFSTKVNIDGIIRDFTTDSTYKKFNYIGDNYTKAINDSDVTEIGIGIINLKTSASEYRRYICIRLTNEKNGQQDTISADALSAKGVVTGNIKTKAESTEIDFDDDYMTSNFSSNEIKLLNTKEFVYKVKQKNNEAGTTSGDTACLIPDLMVKESGKINNELGTYFNNDGNGNLTAIKTFPEDKNYVIQFSIDSTGDPEKDDFVYERYSTQYPISVIANDEVERKSFKDCTFELEGGELENGIKVYPYVPDNVVSYLAVDPTVICKYKDGTDLVKGTDYKVSYANDVQPGSIATVTITGIGAYNGEETTLTYKIKELPKVFEVSLDPINGTKIVGDEITVNAHPKDFDGEVSYTFSYEVDGTTTTLNETTVPEFTFKPQKSGTYTISVTAKDGDKTATATQTVNVSDQLSVSLISNQIDSWGSTFYLQDTVTLFAVGKGGKGGYKYKFVSVDSDGKETVLTEDNSCTYKVAAPAGARTIKVYVWDADDDTSKPSEVYDSIEITGVPVPYINSSDVTVDRIGEIRPNDGIYVGDTVKLRANAQGGIGGITKYRFSVSGNSSLNETNKTGEFEFVPEEVGNYTVTIKAVDAKGNVSVARNETIEVKEKQSDQGSETDEDTTNTVTKLAGNSLSLEGDVGVNFYMILADKVVENQDNAYMQFTLPDDTQQKMKINEAKIDTKTTPNKTYYVFRCNVAAKEMTNTIKAQVFLNDTAVSEQYNYSVKDYADALIRNSESNPDYKKAAPLVSAMLNYGAYSQTYFNYNTNNPAAEIDDATKAKIEAVNDQTINKQYDSSSAKLPDSVQFSGANLELESTTTMNLYFTTDKNLTFTDSNGNELKQIQSGKYTQVVISGITAKDLDEDFTVNVNVNGDNTKYSVTYSPMNYCYNVLARETTAVRTDTLKSLLKTLYLYNVEANAYFKA